MSAQQPEALRSLYEITGNVADVNTVLVNRAELRRLHAENLRLKAQPQQEPFTVLVRKHSWLANQWEAAPRGFPDYGRQWADERINVYTHPQNLNCKSNQARLATLWGYTKEQPKREPLTVEAKAVIDAARAAMDESTESYNGRGDISIASELAAALSLRLDEYARAIERAHGIGGEA